MLTLWHLRSQSRSNIWAKFLCTVHFQGNEMWPGSSHHYHHGCQIMLKVYNKYDNVSIWNRMNISILYRLMMVWRKNWWIVKSNCYKCWSQRSISASKTCRAANWHQTLQNRDILISCQPQRNKTMHPDNWPVLKWAWAEMGSRSVYKHFVSEADIPGLIQNSH